MDRKRWLLLLALCLLLAACSPKTVPDPAAPPAPAPADDPAPVSPEPAQEPVSLNRLTVELVVDWEDADRVLDSRDELSRLLSDALLEMNCTVEEVVVTLGTAGGITGDALREGGVDAAFLPAADYIACEDCAAAVLTTDEAVCTCVAAVTLAREELGGSFPSLLADALLCTDSGVRFLQLYRPGLTFLPADAPALDALRHRLDPAEA